MELELPMQLAGLDLPRIDRPQVIEPSEEGVKDGGACMAGLGRVGAASQ